MITLQTIRAGYGEKDVLRYISLSVPAGDFIALLGPNGSGKSTLLKIMAGQLTASSGSICIDERPLQTFSPKERAGRIAYFPQSRPLPNMDVSTLVAHGRFPQLGFGRVMGEADRDAVRSAIRQTDLTEMAHRPLPSLSGGERQRAYLALLIAQQADILLLDEPGSFLDIRHQLEVMDILQTLNKQGKTILFAAHDLPLAFSYAKRILLLNDGNLTGDAPPEQMAQNEAIEHAFGVRIRQQEGDALFGYTLVSCGGSAPTPPLRRYLS